MSVVNGGPKSPWNADGNIEPLESIAPVVPVSSRRMANVMQIFREGSSRFLGPDAVFNGILLGCFALLATWGILHHAMWRDELQAWLVAVDSRSPAELLQNLRLETHPCLWHLLLYGVSRFTANPVAMQLLHLGLAVTAIWLFLRFSPFRRVEKALFIFGYFPLYEYCVISRDYALVVLLVFLFCTLLQNRPRRYIPIAVVLFCLTNAHAYGFVLALAFFGFLLCERIFGPLDTIPQPRWKLATAVSIATLGFALGLWKCLLVPPSLWRHSLTSERLTQSVATIWRGYVPLPVQFPYWPRFEWGTNFLCDAIAPPVFVVCIFSMVLAMCATAILLDCPKGIFLYGLITGGVLLFQFLFGGGELRQTGLLFVGLIAVIWLSGSAFEGATCAGLLQTICRRIPSWRQSFLMILLVTHVAAGAYAYTAEWTRPFSGAREAAQFIRRQGLSRNPIVASDEGITQGVAAYLQRPLYYADSSRWGSHCPFHLVPQAPAEKVIKSAYQLFGEKGKTVVLALSFQLSLSFNGTNSVLTEIYLGPNAVVYSGANGLVLSPSEVSQLPLPRVKIKKLAQFDKVITDEVYFIYLLEPEQ